MASAYSTARQYNEFIPPVDLNLLMNSMAMKQQAVNENWQAVQSQIDSLGQIDIRRDVDKDYFLNRVNSLVQEVNKAKDITNFEAQSYARRVTGYINQALDPTVMSAISATANVRKEMNFAEEARANNSDDYSAQNHAYLMSKINEWMDDPTLGASSNHIKYTPYTDVKAKMRDMYKEMVGMYGERVIERQDGQGNIIRESFKGLHPHEVEQVFAQLLSPQDQKQLEIDGWYKFGLSTPEIAAERIGTYKAQKNSEIDASIKDIESKISKATGTKKKQLEASLESFREYKQNFLNQVDRLRTPEEVGFFFERENLLGGLKSMYQYQQTKHELKTDLSYWNRLNYNLSREKFYHSSETPEPPTSPFTSVLRSYADLEGEELDIDKALSNINKQFETNYSTSLSTLAEELNVDVSELEEEVTNFLSSYAEGEALFEEAFNNINVTDDKKEWTPIAKMEALKLLMKNKEIVPNEVISQALVKHEKNKQKAQTIDLVNSQTVDVLSENVIGDLTEEMFSLSEKNPTSLSRILLSTLDVGGRVMRVSEFLYSQYIEETGYSSPDPKSEIAQLQSSMRNRPSIHAVAGFARLQEGGDFVRWINKQRDNNTPTWKKIKSSMYANASVSSANSMRTSNRENRDFAVNLAKTLGEKNASNISRIKRERGEYKIVDRDGNDVSNNFPLTINAIEEAHSTLGGARLSQAEQVFSNYYKSGKVKEIYRENALKHDLFNLVRPVDVGINMKELEKQDAQLHSDIITLFATKAVSEGGYTSNEIKGGNVVVSKTLDGEKIKLEGPPIGTSLDKNGKLTTKPGVAIVIPISDLEISAPNLFKYIDTEIATSSLEPTPQTFTPKIGISAFDVNLGEYANYNSSTNLKKLIDVTPTKNKELLTNMVDNSENFEVRIIPTSKNRFNIAYEFNGQTLHENKNIPSQEYEKYFKIMNMKPQMYFFEVFEELLKETEDGK